MNAVAAEPATRGARSLAGVVRRSAWLEDAALLAAAALATLRAEWRIIAEPLTFQTDAQIHEFWMRRFEDPALFRDPLTDALLATGYSPPGFRALYWLASHVVDPVYFGELLPLLLQPLSVWLVFRIVREQTAWRPAAWIASALFLVPWEILRFSGGHPRAFAHPIVLLAVFLLLRRHRAAAVVPLVGFLLYPPAGVTALAVVLLATFDRTQPYLVDGRRAAGAAFSVLTVGGAALIVRLLSGPQELLTESEARRYPELGPGGQIHFFASTTLEYLKQNYSGFALREAGSILAVAALFLLLIRPRNVKLLRWEVWCMPIAALALFATAHAVLFDLYLPHRYTYPLLPFFCIAIGVAVRPTLTALAAVSRLALVPTVLVPIALAVLALTLFPLGPQLSLRAVASWVGDATPYLVFGLAAGALLAAVSWAHAPRPTTARRAAGAAAIVAGSLLVAQVAFAGGGRSKPHVCAAEKLYAYLRTVPKDAVVAGEPRVVNCIPIAARRPVVISSKLYQPWDRDYFPVIRERMFRTVDASYGPSREAIVDLRTSYGADYFLVRNRPRQPVLRRMAPFSQRAARLLETGNLPAALRLPARCATWKGRRLTVYDLACVAGSP